MFAFLLSITEVNLFLLHRYFIWDKDNDIPLLRFRSRLAKALIYNEHIPTSGFQSPRRSKRQRCSSHKLFSAPKHAREYVNGKWVCTNADPYQKYICKTDGCTARMRTCCTCTPGRWMCVTCYAKHVTEV